LIGIDISQVPDSSWNSRLLNSKMGTIYQTVENSEYQKILSDFDHDFIKFLHPNGEIIGQLIISKTPRQGRLKKLKLTKLSFIQDLYRWTYGPVIFDTNFADEIIHSLKNYFKTKKIKAYGSIHPLSVPYFKNLSTLFQIQNWSTFLIDLSIDRDSLWNNLEKHSARKNIERSLKKNVIVKQITKSELLDYFNLLKYTKEKAGVHIDFLDTKTMWSKFNKIGFDIFMAYYQDKPVGGLGISHFNSYLNEWGVARSDIDYKEKLYANDLIKWKVIEWGKKKNYNYFDLTGVNQNPTTSKESGILRYKQKWGGDLIEYNFIKT
jgi:lipid II:glycine glycyltransferase (peptidoglycan interpeptide bridge formation enzyme)